MLSIIIAYEQPAALSPNLPFEEQGETRKTPIPVSQPEKATSDKDVRPKPLQPSGEEEMESVGKIPQSAPFPGSEFERVTKPPSEVDYMNQTYSKWDKIRTALGTADHPEGYWLRFTYNPLNASAGEFVERTVNPEETFPAETGNYILRGTDLGTKTKKSFITSRIDDLKIELVPKTVV